MKKKWVSPYVAFLLFNFAFFMMDTTSGYFSIYLNEIGLTKTNIGTITAAASLVSLLFQPTIGLIADRTRSKSRMLQSIIVCTALLYPLILLSTNVLYILAIYIAYTVLRSSQASINTSMSLEYVEQTSTRYGPIRMMGAVGYALMMALVGQISKIGTQSTFFAYTAICFINVLLIFLLPKMPGHQQKGKRQPFRLVLNNKTIIKLIVFGTIMSLAQGMYHSFFAIFFTQELGGSNALYGTMLSISALCEIPFLFFADRLIQKIGTKRVLFIIALLDSARWTGTFFVTSPYVQMGIQSLNFLNILMQVALTMKMSQSVTPEFKTTVQTLFVTVRTVVSLLFSSLLGGILADAVGLRPLFLISGAISLAAAIIFQFFVFKDSLSDKPASPLSA